MKKLMILLFAILFGLSLNTSKAQNVSIPKNHYVDPSKMNLMQFDKYGLNTRMVTFLYGNDAGKDNSKVIYHVRESPYPMVVYANFFNAISKGNPVNTELQVDSTKLTNIIFGTEGGKRILFLGYDKNSDGFEDARFAYNVNNTNEYNVIKTQLVKYYLDLNNNHELEANEGFRFN